MFIQSQFPYFTPRPYCAPPAWQTPSCRPCGPTDFSNFSSQATLFMLMNAFQSMLGGFQGGYAMPMQQTPMFGGVGGVGGFGPTRCFLGPSRYRPQPSVPAPTKPPAPSPSAGGANVRPLIQSNDSSCGQTSVAMAVNSLTGKSLNDRDINNRYGFGLLSALNGESRGSGYSWRDGGNFSPAKWSLLQKKLNTEKTPVIIGLNGPEFSPSGRGHIVTLLSMDGNNVRYADPADGKIKTTTRQSIERAPSHPDGKFIFYASRG